MTTRTRRRRPAAAGRILASGLSTSAFFGAVGLIARHDQAAQASDAATDPAVPVPDSSSSTPAVPTTGSAVMTVEVHRTFYLDEFGNPVAPPVSGPVVPGREAAKKAEESVVTAPANSAPSPTAAAQPAAPVPAAQPTVTPTPVVEATAPTAAPPPPATEAPAPATPTCSGSEC